MRLKKITTTDILIKQYINIISFNIEKGRYDHNNHLRKRKRKKKREGFVQHLSFTSTMALISQLRGNQSNRNKTQEEMRE